MYPSKDRVSATINTPHISKQKVIEEIHEWIDTKRLFGSIQVLQEDNDHIQIKSPVRFISTGLSARWTPEPMMIYYITFILKENQIILEAEIEYPRSGNMARYYRIFGKLKCRDFLLTFFKQIEVSDDVLFKDLYSKSEIESYLQETNDSMLRNLLLVLILITIITIIGSRDISYVLSTVFTCILFLGTFLFITSRFQTRKYRNILNKYHRDKK